MDNKKIGNFIMTLRKNKNLTQQELGDKLSVTDKAVSKWERGLSFPDITLLNSLAEILEVDVSEILNGEYGKDKNIDIQKAVDEAIENINKLHKEKINKIIKYILFSLILLFLFVLLLINHNKYNPKEFTEGENNYKLENYNLEENGLDKMIEIISKSKNMLDKYNISYFKARLNASGIVSDFTLSLTVFDTNENYIGDASFEYKDNILTYHEPKSDTLPLVRTYSKNSNISYISDKIKKAPINEQIKLSELKFYFVTYDPDTNITLGTPIFDGRDSKEIKALSKEDYNNGLGGKSDANTRVVIRLYDGTSIASGQQYLFVFDELQDTAPNNPSFMMETDYYINRGTLKFTRDYGKTWITTDIKKEELEETLNFYRDISLKPDSWFLSTNESLPIAYFYGEKPVLKISNNNGKTWYSATLPNIQEFDKYVTRRAVGFTSENFGYVALGTDWSMGSGEMKKIYFTNNGRKNLGRNPCSI